MLTSLLLGNPNWVSVLDRILQLSLIEKKGQLSTYLDSVSRPTSWRTEITAPRARSPGSRPAARAAQRGDRHSVQGPLRQTRATAPAAHTAWAAATACRCSEDSWWSKRISGAGNQTTRQLGAFKVFRWLTRLADVASHQSAADTAEAKATERERERKRGWQKKRKRRQDTKKINALYAVLG